MKCFTSDFDIPCSKFEIRAARHWLPSGSRNPHRPLTLPACHLSRPNHIRPHATRLLSHWEERKSCPGCIDCSFVVYGIGSSTDPGVKTCPPLGR